ncbi:hypothetical protein [Paenibacillus sp. RC67]|uniref:hypothetical protein n=1 Tax=Paenibacillus sp. RC67 TaxID=3039392 RepID=UPI0024AE0DBA|nr:hypothetical protein [Paenibacillus sp. RC67]
MNDQKMPFNIALFGINLADAIRADYPEIKHWVSFAAASFSPIRNLGTFVSIGPPLKGGKQNQ